MSLEIVIDGIIGNGPNEISAQMVKAQLPATGEPVTIKIHSEGGSVFEGFSIHDALAAYPGQKTAVIESSAFSIASFIPMACDQIEITPNGFLMLHNPYVEAVGDDEELAKQSALLSQLKNNMVTAYSQRTGRSPEEIQAILKEETYLNANDAVAMGFADRITEKPITGRVFARLDRMPHGVVSALFGAGSNGNQEPLHKEKPMSDSKPVAATVQEIKSAFPKAKSDFIVRCLERQLPLASVAQVAAEEMMTENETLAAKVAAMEEELTSARAMMEELAACAKAMEGGEEEEEDDAKAEYDKEETAKARGGVKPVAKAKSGGPSARAQWHNELNARLAAGKPRAAAILEIEKQIPGLRDSMLAEVNA